MKYLAQETPLPFNPWNNPDPAAIARVKAPFPAPTVCPYCAAGVDLVHNGVLYHGRAYGDWPYAYLCRNNGCRACVGLHPGTAIPLGTLADNELRQARTSVKGVFNRIWQDRHKSRTDAYYWLARQMRIKHWERDCHIGLFTVEQCREAQRHCTAFLTAPRGRTYVNNTKECHDTQ